MYRFLGVLVSLLISLGLLSFASAADRVVVCEEFYQEF